MIARSLINRGRTSEGLTRHHEGSSLFSFQREMNRLFDNFFDGFDLASVETTLAPKFSPKVNVTETEKEIRVTAELPGLDEKDVTVELDNESLVIKGEKKEEHEEKGKSWYRMEQSYGAFHRVIPLPSKIDESKAKATFKKGVLSLTIPKVEIEERKKKQIEINAE